MISAAELAAMQAVQEEALPGTCVISRRTLTSDGMGGNSESWLSVGTVSCRVSPATESGAERPVAERPLEVGPWIITTPHNTDVTPKDRVTWEGRTFEVTASLGKSWETARRVVSIEVM